MSSVSVFYRHSSREDSVTGLINPSVTLSDGFFTVGNRSDGTVKVKAIFSALDVSRIEINEDASVD